MDLLKEIITYSDEKGLITHDDSVLVALSGGADSVALLHILSKLRKKYNLTISAVYLNHQLRKKEAKKEEIFCQNLCDSLDIEFHIASEDIKSLAKKLNTGIEETARNYRYELFETLAHEYSYNKIALGHHQNDQIETILFRIFRGTGKKGLMGIPPKRDIYIRPLLNTPKEEILAYIKKNKLSYCEDSSNKKSLYRRNYIRNKLIPLLKSHLNNSVENAILNLSENISDEEKYLENIVAKKIKNICSISAGNKIILKKENFFKIENWIQKRILRDILSALSETNKYPDKITVDRILDAVKSDKKALSIPTKLEMRVLSDRILFLKRKKIKFKQKLEHSVVYHLEKINYIIKSRLLDKIPQSLRENKNGNIGRFDFAKIEGPLYIRSIKEGDRFQPFGMQGTKKIGNYLTDRKIDRVFRDEILVVEDKCGLIWVVGHQIDERVKIDKSTKKVLEIECRRKKSKII